MTSLAVPAAAPAPTRHPVQLVPGQPPLSSWGHTWRIGLSLVFGLLLLTLTVGTAPEPWTPLVGGLLVVDLVLGTASLVLLAFHRRWPLPVAGLVVLFTAASSLAAGAGLVCLVSIAARRRFREIIPIGLLSVASGLAYAFLYPNDGLPLLWSSLGFVVLQTSVIVAFGMYLGARRELVYSWRLRAEGADREQALTAEHAKFAERARIAREMHDVLAHRISLLSLHAGALAFRENLPPETVRDEARVIQATAREALDELRAVLGELRDSPAGPSAIERPQPTLVDLAPLIGEAQTVSDVTVENLLDGNDPPPWLGRHAYRVIQESLTNARRHAPGAHVLVRLAGRPGGQLEVVVTNDAPTRPSDPGGGAGLGLVGLAERAALAGGLFEHGPTPNGGYVVRVDLPWAVQADHD